MISHSPLAGKSKPNPVYAYKFPTLELNALAKAIDVYNTLSLENVAVMSNTDYHCLQVYNVFSVKGNNSLKI